MTLNPPLRLNGVEVTSIHATAHTLHCVVFMEGCIPIHIKTPEMQETIQHRIDNTVRYMEVEGFIPMGEQWLIHSGVVMVS